MLHFIPSLPGAADISFRCIERDESLSGLIERDMGPLTCCSRRIWWCSFHNTHVACEYIISKALWGVQRLYLFILSNKRTRVHSQMLGHQRAPRSQHDLGGHLRSGCSLHHNNHPSEFDVALVLDKGSVPRDLAFLRSQLGVKVTVSRAIQLHALDLAVSRTLIGVEESAISDQNVSTAHNRTRKHIQKRTRNDNSPKSQDSPVSLGRQRRISNT